MCVGQVGISNGSAKLFAPTAAPNKIAVIYFWTTKKSSGCRKPTLFPPLKQMNPTEESRKAHRKGLWPAIVALLFGVIPYMSVAWNGVRYWGVENAGVETTGYITYVARTGHGPIVNYEYSVEGRTYKGDSRVSRAYGRTVEDNIGGEIPIIYYKNYPRLSAIRGFNDGWEFVCLFPLASIFFVLGILWLADWIRQEWKIRHSETVETGLPEP